MRRWLLTGLAWAAATLLLLPDFLKSPVFIVCIVVLLGVPAWIARAVWRR